MTEDFEKITVSLLEIPEGPEALQYLVRHGRKTARREELEQRFIGEIPAEVIYSEAEVAFEALSILLGDDSYFFVKR